MRLNSYLKRIQENKCDKFFCTKCSKVSIVESGLAICCEKKMVNISSIVENILSEAEGFHGLPKGWSGKSVQKFGKSLTGKEGKQKGFFDKCVERMKDKVGNPQAFCAAAKDEITGSTYWRGKGKTSQKGGKDIETHQNVKQD